MKIFIALIMSVTAAYAHAGVTTCQGSVEGKSVKFIIEKDETSALKSLTATIDDVQVSEGFTAVRSLELAGGVMMTSEPPNTIAINSVSVFSDPERGCGFTKAAPDATAETTETADTSCALGWLSLYSQDIVYGGIKLSCE